MSKWKIRKPSKPQEKIFIFPHYHCAACTRMIEKDSPHFKKIIKKGPLESYERFCNEECHNQIYKRKKKSKKKLILVWIIIAIVTTILIIVLAMF